LQQDFRRFYVLTFFNKNLSKELGEFTTTAGGRGAPSGQSPDEPQAAKPPAAVFALCAKTRSAPAQPPFRRFFKKITKPY